MILTPSRITLHWTIPRLLAASFRESFITLVSWKTTQKSGSKPPELKGWRYRQIVEPPCRVFYREDSGRVFILYVMRTERLLRPKLLAELDEKKDGP